MKTPSTTHYWLVTPRGNSYGKRDMGPISYTFPDANNPNQADTEAVSAPKVVGNAAIIQSVSAPTDAQCQAALGLDALSMAKKAQAAKVTAAYNAALAAGISATADGTTLTLASDEAAQVAFTKQQLLLVSADYDLQSNSVAEAAFRTGTDMIQDNTGQPHVLARWTIKQLIDAYAAALKALWIAYQTKLTNIQAATTVAAVQAIS